MKSLKLIIFFFIYLATNFSHTFAEVRIITKINNQIITNIDVINEQQYLLALNKNLSNLDKEDLNKIAKESIVREKIKKIELNKIFILDQKNKAFDDAVERIYKNLSLKNLEEFKSYLKNKNLEFDQIYKKIEIETLWNQLIYTKFKDRLIIDRNSLREKLSKEFKAEKKKLIKFSEILYSYEQKDQIDEIYNKIKVDLNEKKFSEVVINYSISDSAKNNGSLDWVNLDILSDEIKEKVKNLKKGEISKPIIVPSGALLLKVDEIKIVEEKIDIEAELNKFIQFEMNNQLNNYSLIYFKKLKSNTIINEY